MDVGDFGQGQGCSSLKEWDRWRFAGRRIVLRRRRHGLDTGAAVSSIIRRRGGAGRCRHGRAREGDEDGLRLLYLLYADNVFGYVLAIVHDEHDAEDVTSEVFRACHGRSPTTG